MNDTNYKPEVIAAAQGFLLDFLAYDPAQSLVITTDTARRAGVVEALQAVALAVGGRPTVVTIPQLPYQGKLADPYLPGVLAAAVRDCDLWIDLTFPYIAGSTLHAQALGAGAKRYMLASDMSAEAMLRLFKPGVLDALSDEQARFESLFARSVGRTVRITSPAGTDVTFKLAESLGPSPRKATEAGLYFLPGSCLLNPAIETVQGKIVLETVFHEYYTPLKTPIELDVDGRIRAVRGGGPERAVLERALLRAGSGQYGYIIHFAHGVHPAARFTGNCFVEDMRAFGSNAIGMGLPFWQPDGGENHPDGVVTMHSIWLDGVQIVKDGDAVPWGTRFE